jgi:hypothetical protein
MTCLIVCPVACRGCEILDCADRVAPQEGRRGGSNVSRVWDDELDELKERELQRKCTMRDEFMCRHCHEEDCAVRLAPRRY